MVLALTLTPMSGILEAACKTKVIVLFDVSGSTESEEPVDVVIDVLLNGPTTARPEYLFEFIPFEGEVGDCARFNTNNLAADSKATQEIFANCLSFAKSHPRLQTETTDLNEALLKVSAESSREISPGSRRIFLLFSDMQHEPMQKDQENSRDWIRRHKASLAGIKYNLKRIAGQKMLVFLQESKTKSAMSYSEINNIADALNHDFIAQEIALKERGRLRGIYERLLIDEVENDPTPLEVKLEGFMPDKKKLKVKVYNPSCFERQRLDYELRDSKGLVYGGKARPAKCDPWPSRETFCAIPLPDVKNCKEKHSVRIIPDGEGNLAGETDLFSLNDCFEIRSVQLDVAKRLDGAPHFQECYRRSTRDSEEWERWKKDDLTKQAGEVEFLACIKAKGSVGAHLGKFVLRDEQQKGDDGKSISRVVRDVPLERFVDGAPPNVYRHFPIFFKLSSEEARLFCSGAHEMPRDQVYLRYGISRASNPGREIELSEKDPRILLARDPNREAEENLHDLWESILVPVGFIMLFVFLAMRSHRHGSPALVEELLAVIGLGVATLAAALHDASKLGDDAERWFARDPVFLTCIGIGALLSFFLRLLWSGALEPRRTPEAGVRIVLTSSLTKRKIVLWVRVGTWFLGMGGLAGFGWYYTINHPKDIESCHYEGIVSAQSADDR